MFDKWLKLPAHKYLHLTALSILVVGVTLSNVLMSIGTIWIIANWLIELNFKSKLDKFKSNKQVIAICSLFLLMVVSLFWSSNLNYGLKDILIKLPLITIPLVMGTIEPLKKPYHIYLWYLFLASLTFTTVFNVIYYYQYQLNDIRQMSGFISHIRLGGLICMAILVTTYHIIKKDLKLWISLPILGWLMYYLFLSQTLTAYVLFVILILASLVYVIKHKVVKWGLMVLYVLPFVLFFTISVNPIKSNNNNDIGELVWYTPNGNSYYHDTTSTLTENGNYVWLYVSIDECEKEWNKRSVLPYNGEDKKGQPLYGTLFRYMTSLNLRKDSVGFTKLSDQDIINIENGHTNYKFNAGLKDKLNELYIDFYTMSAGGDPNGHSFLQRIEHFKTGVNVLKQNYLFGVGIGDVDVAFKTQYQIDKTKLLPENQHRAHNQILTSWITLGVLGLILTLFILFSPFVNSKMSYPLFVVSLTIVFGFLTQDMLETQAGVTIFGLFYALFNFNESYGKN